MNRQVAKRKIIIDTDPGVDDAFAIGLALSSQKLEVLGITASMGNTGLDITTSNAVRLAKYFGATCKVYRGEEEYVTSSEKIVSKGVHGDDGLGGISSQLEYDESYLSTQSAVDFILETVNKYPNEVEIITLAPLTNIAKAIQKDPSTMKKVKAIYSMGGGVKRGNVTPYAEFNYYADPKALEVTYSIGDSVDIYMFGLDVTHKTIFTCNDIFYMKKTGGHVGELLSKMADVYLDAYWGFSGYLGTVIHDMLVVAYTIDESVCPKTKRATITTEISGEKQGITKCEFVDDYNKGNTYVVSSVDTFKYKKLFFEEMFGSYVAEKYTTTIQAMNDCNNGYEEIEVL